MSFVYFDHNATTPLDERVFAAMLPFLREQYGNVARSGGAEGCAPGCCGPGASASLALGYSPEDLAAVPEGLNGYALELAYGGNQLIYTCDTQASETGIAGLLRRLHDVGVEFKDLHTEQSSLEDIFVNLVSTRA